MCDTEKLLHYNNIEKLLNTLIKQLSGMFGKQEGNQIDNEMDCEGFFKSKLLEVKQDIEI